MAILLPKRSSSDDGESREGRVLRERIDAFERRHYEAEIAALRARVNEGRDRSYSGGPCSYCGVSESFGRWHGTLAKTIMCSDCIDDHWWHDDVEHRSLVINMLVSGNTEMRTFSYGQMAREQIKRTRFKWWHETPGAQPGGWGRFAYVDLEALRKRAAPPTPQPPPANQGGDPCPRCGCAFMYRELGTWPQVVPSRDPDNADVVFDRERGYGCAGCVSYESLGDVIRRIIGVNAGSYRVLDRHGVHHYEADDLDQLGVTWFADRPKRSDDRRRAVTLAPFAYLDLAAIRKRALQLFPFESQWVNPNTYAALVAEHGNPLGPPLVGRTDE